VAGLGGACQALPESGDELSETQAAVTLQTPSLPIQPAAPRIKLTQLGSYASGIWRAGGAEIVAHDPRTQRLFVINASAGTVDVLDISDPAHPTKVDWLPASATSGGVNSVAIRAGLVAVATDAPVKTDPGSVVFYDSRTLAKLAEVKVGAIPDMVTFTPNGRYLLVANEGEPSSYNQPDSVDPEGSISIISLAGDIRRLDASRVRTAHFRAFNGRKAELQAAGVRIFGPNATVAQDLEPEYIAVSHDSRTAWVTLQENNALAIVDIDAAVVRDIVPLGLKDHMATGNAIDANDTDGIKIVSRPVKGMYQPDAIDAYQHRGETYLVMANEGDAREYTGLMEEVRVGNAAYPLSWADAAAWKSNAQLGRLNVSRSTGDLDGDGRFDEIHAFGARSFSIRSASGALVFDSGDHMERLTEDRFPAHFNVSNHTNAFDSRSTSKGPEPEGVVLGKAFGRVYAFVGLERVGGVTVYDVTNPHAVAFEAYVNNRNFALVPGPGTIAPGASPDVGDLGPEGLTFIKEEDSPNGRPLLVVGNEVSGTTTIYAIDRR
jgi:DNA-binding beta-propeller fold protein YncE